MPKPNFNDNVFINCPFDPAYDSMLRSIIFVVYHCGFVPRCAKEELDSSVRRMDKIYNIISECKYGIHDISCTEMDSITKLPRFNMPLELGLFLGAKRYGKQPNNKKECVIIDSEQFRYHKFISDISGQDIRAHKKKPETCVTMLRDWLSTKSASKVIPTGDIIWEKYKMYLVELPDICSKLKLTPTKITYNDYVQLTASWIKNN